MANGQSVIWGTQASSPELEARESESSGINQGWAANARTGSTGSTSHGLCQSVQVEEWEEQWEAAKSRSPIMRATDLCSKEVVWFQAARVA